MCIQIQWWQGLRKNKRCKGLKEVLNRRETTAAEKPKTDNEYYRQTNYSTYPFDQTHGGRWFSTIYSPKLLNNELLSIDFFNLLH